MDIAAALGMNRGGIQDAADQRMKSKGMQSVRAQEGGQANATAGVPPQPSNPWGVQAPSASSGYSTGQGMPASADASASAKWAAPMAQMQGSQGPPTIGGMQSLAQQFAQRASQFADPDVRGMKAQAQNTVARGMQDAQQQARMSAARRGVMQSGNLGAQERRAADAAMGNLTNAYTNIDMQANQQGFQNNLGMTGALQGLAGQLIGQDQFGQSHNLQAELGRRGANTADAQVNLQSMLGRAGLDLDERRFGEDTRRFNLSDQRQQEAQAAQAAASRDRARQQEEYNRQQLATQTRNYDMGLLELILGSM